MPKGLFISLAIFADSLLKPIPTEQVKLVNSFILSLNFKANCFLFYFFKLSLIDNCINVFLFISPKYIPKSLISSSCSKEFKSSNISL